MKNIYLLSALKIEIIPFIEAFNATKTHLTSKLSQYNGQYKDLDITIANLGVGKNFNKNISKINLDNADAIFLIGMAGGLKSEHQIGDPVVPENILSPESREIEDVNHPSEQLLYRLEHIRPNGNMLCVKKVVTKEDKEELSKAVEYVDMESYYFSDYLKTKNTPFMVIKSVSDNLATKFPNLEFVKSSIKHINFTKAFFYFIRHPKEFVTLVQFYQNMRTAIESNYKTVTKVIDEIFE